MSAWSACVTGATQGATPPAPYDLSAVQVGQTFIYIAWTNPSGYSLTNNIVYVSAPGGPCGPAWATTINLGEVTSSENITGLIAGQTYFIEVTAVDAQSPYSAPLYVTTSGTPAPNALWGVGPLLVVLVGIGAVAALVLVVVIERRRRSPPRQSICPPSSPDPRTQPLEPPTGGTIEET